MHYNLWTDGACSNNGKTGSVGGWGYIIVDPYRRIIAKDSGAESPSTNNRMEIISILNALKKFDEINVSGFDTCTIITDSAYVFNCKQQGWYRSWQINGWINSAKKPVKNAELWRELIPYFERLNISWEKVRGHAGVSFNEMVDELAVTARKEYKHE